MEFTTKLIPAFIKYDFVSENSGVNVLPVNKFTNKVIFFLKMSFLVKT